MGNRKTNRAVIQIYIQLFGCQAMIETQLKTKTSRIQRFIKKMLFNIKV